MTSKTIQRNYATMNGKVMGLDKQMQVTEDKLRKAAEREAALREIIVLEVKQPAIDEFRQSKE